MAQALFSAYIDSQDFQNNASMNVETASLIGGNTTLQSPATAGGTTLLWNDKTGFQTVFPFTAWVLDGANSETVSIASISGASAPYTATLAAGTTLLANHAAGVSVSSAGIAGCLASVIARASAAVEAICKQGADAGGDRTLFQKSRTERLSGPSTWRAAFDVDHNLKLRPYHFPVVSVSALTVQMGANSAAAIDTTYLYLPDAAKRIEVPYAQVIGSSPSVTYGAPFPRSFPFVATLTYVGGPCSGTTFDSVPYNVREATYLMVADVLSFRVNPTGAAEVGRGNVHYTTRLRGDTSGKNILRLTAEELLREYTNAL